MIVLDYCLNKNCINLALKNKLLCKTCFTQNIYNLLKPFIKGWLIRYKTNKYYESITTIQSFIKMKSISKYFNSPLFQSSSYLTPDEGIIKHVLYKGNNTFPQKKQIVNFHCKGMYLNGTIFYNSYKNDSKIEFELGDNNYMKLWNIGILSMSLDERCILIGSQEYCKNAELMNFPKNENLIFEIELLEIKNIEIIKNMSLENRLINVYNYKSEGDILYNNNNLINASKLYIKALKYLFEEDEDPEKTIIIQNLSNIYEKLEQWDECLKYSKLALSTTDNTIIYLYKIAKCYFNMKNYDNCINMCNKILFNENNSNILEMKQKCLSMKTFENIDKKNIYNIMFNNPRDTH